MSTAIDQVLDLIGSQPSAAGPAEGRFVVAFEPEGPLHPRASRRGNTRSCSILRRALPSPRQGKVFALSHVSTLDLVDRER
jgi:hypothetical protein